MTNVVVIGCGAVLEQCHRKALQKLAPKLGFKVIGLVDPSPERIDKAREWFPSAQAFAAPGDCYDQVKDVRLTVITSPPPFHAAQAEAAFAHGSHVLCEKPLAGSVQDAKRMVQAAREHKKVLALGMTRRYYPCLTEVRKRIADGALGERVTFFYREGGIYGWPVATAAPFRRESSGGGVLLDKGVHALDSLGFLFGEGQVLESSDDGPLESVEANSLTNLVLKRSSGTMQLSWDMNLANGLHIRGSKGEYWIPIGPLDLLFSRPNRKAEWVREQIRVEWPLDLKPESVQRGCPADYDQCFEFQLAQTLRAIHLGESPAATGEDGVATLRLINDAYTMAMPLTKPWLSKAEQEFWIQHHRRNQAR